MEGSPAGRCGTDSTAAVGERLSDGRGESSGRRSRAGGASPAQRNAEYTYTLRDFTGIDSLDPARQFPGDGAAGEGFTNTGTRTRDVAGAILTKYLDAAKEVASHAVLLPDGFRFSPHTTPRDWTEETLAQIREFYSRVQRSAWGRQGESSRLIARQNAQSRPRSNSSARSWRASWSSTALTMPVSSASTKAPATSTYSDTTARAGTSERQASS